MHRRILALTAFAPVLALAQPAVPDPADAKAAVPPLAYESAIPRAKPAEAKPGPWKQVNEQVGRLGGHAGHLKALEPSTSPAKRPPAAPGTVEKRSGDRP